MRNQRQMIEDRNYAGDRRVQALGLPELEFDENSMTLIWETDHDCDIGDCDETCTVTEPTRIAFPAYYVVCDLCDGKGKHVSPSIDAGGIGEDDEFWADDEDEETGESRYMRGDYDVECYRCHGKRIAPQLRREECNKEDLARYDMHLEGLEEDAAERAAEARWGC